MSILPFTVVVIIAVSHWARGRCKLLSPLIHMESSTYFSPASFTGKARHAVSPHRLPTTNVAYGVQSAEASHKHHY